MTDLDPTGARANTPGLTKQALRDEKRRKREADRKAFVDSIGRGIGALMGNLPMALLAAIVVAVLGAATLFDWYMSSRGWQDILPGMGVFAWFGAAASVGFWYVGAYMVGHELYRNKGRDKAKREYAEAIIWGIVACVAYLVCVGGVIVATITNTAEAKFAAQESRKEFAQLVAARDELEENLEIYSVEYWEQRLAADERTARGRLNIAKATLGMEDLDVDGGCALKLNFNQQRACAYWNGGTDPATGKDVDGILSDIEQDKSGLKKAREDDAKLKDLQAQVRTYKVKTGDETARALGEYFEGESAGNQVLMVIITLFSAGFLLCGGLFGHGAIRFLVKRAA